MFLEAEEVQGCCVVVLKAAALMRPLPYGCDYSTSTLYTSSTGSKSKYSSLETLSFASTLSIQGASCSRFYTSNVDHGLRLSHLRAFLMICKGLVWSHRAVERTNCTRSAL